MTSLPAAFVVDASVTAAWFLPDEATPPTEATLQATATAEVWVPALWTLEMANLLLRAQRRKRIGAAKRLELVRAVAGLRLRIDREPVSIAVIDEIAARHVLSAYDAVYVELAMRRGLPLATLDRAMVEALAAAGVAPAM